MPGLTDLCIATDETQRMDLELYGSSFTTAEGLRLDPTRVTLDTETTPYPSTITRFRYRLADGGEVVFVAKRVTRPIRCR